MKVRLTRVSGTAYAKIETENKTLDVLLRSGMTAGASMRQSARELREKAESLQSRADLIERAQDLI